MALKTYSELIKLPTFEDRYNYLRLSGTIGDETFGHNRYLNQAFYNSKEYRDFRNYIILRDQGFDLGIEGYPIQEIRRKHKNPNSNDDYYGIIIHHLNPITDYDILNRAFCLMDPENAISVSHQTHMAIHYGSFDTLPHYTINERRPGDTKLW